MSKKKPASIGRLPEEMQAYILSKLDGKSAAIAKRVCRLWRDLLFGMESCMHFWLRKCLKEMPSYALVEFSRMMYISSRTEETLALLCIDSRNSRNKLPWMFWREVYAEYHRCSYILDGSYKKTELHFFPLYGEVTCLYMQDNDIFSGHVSGAVMCWSNIEGDLSSEILYRHEKYVTSLTGIRQETTVNQLIEGDNTIRLVSSSKDNTLIVHKCSEEVEEKEENTNTIQHFYKTVNCVRSWGNKIFACAPKVIVQGQPVWTISDDCKHDIDCTLFSESVNNMTAVAFWEDTVISGDDSGDLYYWSLCMDCQRLSRTGRKEATMIRVVISGDDSGDLYYWSLCMDCQRLSRTGRKEATMIHVGSLESCVRKIYLLGTRIVAFTDDRHLHIGSQNFTKDHNFTSIDIYEHIEKVPECFAVRGAILAIGCKGGAVFLYHIPTDNSWDNLNLGAPAHVIKTSCDHINDIYIGDDGGGPVITIATTGNCIHVVQFRLRKQIGEVLEEPS